MLLAFLLSYAVHLGIVHLLRHAVNGAAYLVLRHTVEFIKGIVKLSLTREQYAQAIVTHNLMHKRILYVCHVGIVGNNNSHLASHRIEATLHSALAHGR